MFDKNLPSLSREVARRLIERIETIPLFAHAYSFHLNFRLGDFGVEDLFDFAYANHLQGVKIHLDDGEEQSLRLADDETVARYKKSAEDKDLEIHLEISSTELAELELACRIGVAIGATSIRCYPRYEGRVSAVIERSIAALRLLEGMDPEGKFVFTLEQHEDLKSSELVRIVDAVDNPCLSLMFDFSNMLNANEIPLDALRNMAPHITDVHIKDAKVIEERGGWGQLGCKSGSGDIPQARLLLDLLLLGENEPQIRAFGLEEEVGFYAPPFRFPREETDPLIPARDASETDIAEGEDLPSRLADERRDANEQLAHIRTLLASLRTHALSFLGE